MMGEGLPTEPPPWSEAFFLPHEWCEPAAWSSQYYESEGGD